MRCQPLRRALTLSHVRVKTSSFRNVALQRVLPSMCVAHTYVGYFLEVRCTSFNFQLLCNLLHGITTPSIQTGDSYGNKRNSGCNHHDLRSYVQT